MNKKDALFLIGVPTAVAGFSYEGELMTVTAIVWKAVGATGSVMMLEGVKR